MTERDYNRPYAIDLVTVLDKPEGHRDVDEVVAVDAGEPEHQAGRRAGGRRVWRQANFKIIVANALARDCIVERVSGGLLRQQ
jgi:hypothetical protein